MHVCWFSRLSDDQLAGLRGGGAGSVELLLRPRADAAAVLRKVDGSFARIRIGQPRRLLTTGYRYGAWMDQDDGNQATSKMSAGLQAVSNDCPFGIHANTNCVGLRSSAGSRTFPRRQGV